MLPSWLVFQALSKSGQRDATESDNVEENDGTQPEDDGADGDFFTPCHLNIGTLHATAFGEAAGKGSTML